MSGEIINVAELQAKLKQVEDLLRLKDEELATRCGGRIAVVCCSLFIPARA